MAFAFGSTRDSDDDWRSQMDSKYSGSEYSDLVSFSSKLHFGGEVAQEFAYGGQHTSLKKETFDAIRFPPVPSVQLPEEIYKRDYEQDFELRASFRPTQNSVEDNDSIAALDFLEGLLLTAVEKAVDIRSSVIENGSFVMGLSRTPDQEEINYMKNIIAENLNTLRDESLVLMGEMEAFQPESVTEMVYLEAESTNDAIRRLKQSLEDRANAIKSEIAASALVVDGLQHFSNAIICLPSEKVCKIDGIYLDWSMPRKLQDKVQASNRALNFADFMRSHGFPVCNDIYAYLQSTKSHGQVLSVVNYHFKVGEFKLVMEFLDLQADKAATRLAGDAFLSVYRSVHSLVFQHCELSDRDCHALATRLHRFSSLVSLNLRDNRISISGVGSIAAALFEHGSQMRSLRLDNNLIKTDGALFIAQVLHRMPFLEILSLSGNPIRDRGLYYLLKYSLNVLRATHGKLYKPSLRAAVSVAGSSLWEDDDGEGDEVSEAEDAQDAVADIKLDTEQKRSLRRRIAKRCYFDDYFKSHYSLRGRREAEIAEDADEEAHGLALREKAQWINQEEDEFNMDVASEYSDDDGGDGARSIDSLRSNVGSSRDEDFGDASTVYTNVTAAVIERRDAKRNETYADCHLLVQMFLKVRVKLIAVSMFTRQLRTGNVLTSLGAAGCKLSADVVSTITEALLDNHHITSLDVSHNPELLVSLPACQTMAHLIERGHLSTLLLNDCGVNDRGFNELTRGATLSRTMRNLELSGNHVGPTGANWAATANTVFFVDTLEISGGYHSSAPFKKKGDPTLTSIFDEFESRVPVDSRAGTDEGKGQGGDAGDGYGSDLDSYLDTDLFDGEDEENYPEDLLSLDQSAEEEGNDEDGYLEELSEAQLDDDATLGGTVVSRGAASQASVPNSQQPVAQQPHRRGIVSYLRRGLRRRKSQGSAHTESDTEHK